MLEPDPPRRAAKRVRLGFSRNRKRTQVALASAGCLAAVVVATGCGGAGGTGAGRPPIDVVTGLYPLAQAAAQVGGSHVRVTDVVPAGTDPRTYQLTAPQVAAVRTAAAVLLIGGGFQPSLERAAATGRPGVVDLRAALATRDPYVWLQPPLMHRAIDAIATDLAGVDPAAGGFFRNNAAAYADQVDSTGIDYQSTLSVCPRRAIVTEDGAFSAMARTYGLIDVIAGSGSPASVADVARTATADGATTAFAEPFGPPATVRAVAAVAHLTVRTLDPLTGPPPSGWPRQATYIRLMEANLGALAAALGCPDTSTGLS